jgi:hypothetical protein
MQMEEERPGPMDDVNVVPQSLAVQSDVQSDVRTKVILNISPSGTSSVYVPCDE